MGYFIGNDILDDEYNIFVTGSANGIPNHSVTNINTVLGTGDGADKGYGQISPLSPVSVGADISATQWASLLNTNADIASHQGTTLAPVTSPTGGDDIEIITNLQQNIADIYFNRLNCAATGTPITAGGTVTRTATWNGQVTATYSVTFASADHMRYFFNAGGRITISGSRTGGAANPKNTAWTNFLADMGTLNIAAPSGAVNAEIASTFYTGFTKTGGAGTPSTYLTGTGIYDLTGTLTELFRQYSTEYLYEVNYVRLSASVTGGTISLSIQYVDAENTPEENVDGNTNFVVNAVPPATTFISNTWGTPVISGSQSGS